MLQPGCMRLFFSFFFLFIFFTVVSFAGHSRSKSRLPDPAEKTEARPFLNLEELKKVLLSRKATQFILGKSKKGRDVTAYFFPGSSNKRALIIGGIHGSELSSIEVAKELMSQLEDGDSIFYNVIIIPSLFPDNAVKANENISELGSIKNIGRYSYAGAVDPNRQMPTPGLPFDEKDNLDHAGRKIENENSLLLDLINQFKPDRMISLHAIRNTELAGVFADPRCDHRGIALGYASDSSLAIMIASAIEAEGACTPGNRLYKKPTALYYKDPPAVPKGKVQRRNLTGAPLPGYKGAGISLGTWASTAVVNKKDPLKNREAIRILTIEFPGSKRPSDHKPALQYFYQLQVRSYAKAVKNIFLGNYFSEEENPQIVGNGIHDLLAQNGL